MQVVIVGAGAAGCFAAIELKRRSPETRVTVLERGTRPLAKVAITGGGRCNLTNSFAKVKSLEAVYPRGHRLLKRLFHAFSPADTQQWFEREGVKLVTQEDECVFPQSQDAMEIVNTLLKRMHQLGVIVQTTCTVRTIEPVENGYALHIEQTKRVGVTDQVYTSVLQADKVIVTTGGHPRISGFDMLRNFDLEIISPVAGLFSFTIPDRNLTSLMGTVVEHAGVSLVGTKLKSDGPLLITHWGMSGPAILRLSSYAARILAEQAYKARISVQWLHPLTTEQVTDLLEAYRERHAQKQLASVYPTELNARLWQHLLQRAELHPESRWSELRGKLRNRLVNVLTNDLYEVAGKSKFKEEFVTCGGIALKELNAETLECKKYPGLYFAGEVTDVDAVTGGFNLQAAWTMGWVAAKGCVE